MNSKISIGVVENYIFRYEAGGLPADLKPVPPEEERIKLDEDGHGGVVEMGPANAGRLGSWDHREVTSVRLGSNPLLAAYNDDIRTAALEEGAVVYSPRRQLGDQAELRPEGSGSPTLRRKTDREREEAERGKQLRRGDLARDGRVADPYRLKRIDGVVKEGRGVTGEGVTKENTTSHGLPLPPAATARQERQRMLAAGKGAVRDAPVGPSRSTGEFSSPLLPLTAPILTLKHSAGARIMDYGQLVKARRSLMEVDTFSDARYVAFRNGCPEDLEVLHFAPLKTPLETHAFFIARSNKASPNNTKHHRLAQHEDLRIMKRAMYLDDSYVDHYWTSIAENIRLGILSIRAAVRRHSRPRGRSPGSPDRNGRQSLTDAGQNGPDEAELPFVPLREALHAHFQQLSAKLVLSKAADGSKRLRIVDSGGKEAAAELDRRKKKSRQTGMGGLVQEEIEKQYSPSQNRAIKKMMDDLDAQLATFRAREAELDGEDGVPSRVFVADEDVHVDLAMLGGGVAKAGVTVGGGGMAGKKAGVSRDGKAGVEAPVLLRFEGLNVITPAALDELLLFDIPNTAGTICRRRRLEFDGTNQNRLGHFFNQTRFWLFRRLERLQGWLLMLKERRTFKRTLRERQLQQELLSARTGIPVYPSRLLLLRRRPQLIHPALCGNGGDALLTTALGKTLEDCMGFRIREVNPDKGSYSAANYLLDHDQGVAVGGTTSGSNTGDKMRKCFVVAKLELGCRLHDNLQVRLGDQLTHVNERRVRQEAVFRDLAARDLRLPLVLEFQQNYHSVEGSVFRKPPFFSAIPFFTRLPNQPNRGRRNFYLLLKAFGHVASELEYLVKLKPHLDGDLLLGPAAVQIAEFKRTADSAYKKQRESLCPGLVLMLDWDKLPVNVQEELEDDMPNEARRNWDWENPVAAGLSGGGGAGWEMEDGEADRGEADVVFNGLLRESGLTAGDVPAPVGRVDRPDLGELEREPDDMSAWTKDRDPMQEHVLEEAEVDPEAMAGASAQQIAAELEKKHRLTKPPANDLFGLRKSDTTASARFWKKLAEIDEFRLVGFCTLDTFAKVLALQQLELDKIEQKERLLVRRRFFDPETRPRILLKDPTDGSVAEAGERRAGGVDGKVDEDEYMIEAKKFVMGRGGGGEQCC